jgi:hypothetical protein
MNGSRENLVDEDEKEGDTVNSGNVGDLDHREIPVLGVSEEAPRKGKESEIGAEILHSDPESRHQRDAPGGEPAAGKITEYGEQGKEKSEEQHGGDEVGDVEVADLQGPPIGPDTMYDPEEISHAGGGPRTSLASQDQEKRGKTEPGQESEVEGRIGSGNQESGGNRGGGGNGSLPTVVLRMVHFTDRVTFILESDITGTIRAPRC